MADLVVGSHEANIFLPVVLYFNLIKQDDMALQ